MVFDLKYCADLAQSLTLALTAIGVLFIAKKIVVNLVFASSGRDVARPVILTPRELRTLVLGSLLFHFTFYFCVYGIKCVKAASMIPVPHFLSGWSEWDGAHYLTLATYGYQNTPAHDLATLIVFPPLFPAGVALLHHLTGFSHLNSALVLNSVLPPFLAIGLYKLARLDQLPRDAKRSVVCAFTAPYAAFHFATYTEALFLTLVVWGFYLARVGDFKGSATASFFAALVRTSGYFMTLGLALELFGRGWPRLRRGPGAQVMAATAVAFGIYLAFNRFTYGDSWRFLFWQRVNWSKEPGSFLAGLRGALWFSSFDGFWRGEGFFDSNNPEALAIICLGVSLCLVGYAFRPSYGVFILACFVFYLSTSFVMSTPRYASILFPIYLWLGGAFGKRVWAFRALITVFILSELAIAVRFTSGWWVA